MFRKYTVLSFFFFLLKQLIVIFLFFKAFPYLSPKHNSSELQGQISLQLYFILRKKKQLPDCDKLDLHAFAYKPKFCVNKAASKPPF